MGAVRHLPTAPSSTIRWTLTRETDPTQRPAADGRPAAARPGPAVATSRIAAPILHGVGRDQRAHRRVGDALHMRAHAGADVEEHQHVHRHVFTGEVADGLRTALFAQDEIGDAEAGDGAVIAVHYLGVDAHQ